MKPVETNKLLNFADFIGHSNIYIETGTCYGGSVKKAMEAGYKTIKSVEVYEPFYLKCQETFRDNKNVELFFGKSDEKMKEMLEDIRQPAVIFLDAHPAGPNTGGHDDLMEKGAESEYHQDTVLKRELAAILAHNPRHIIIIDDQNGENPDNEHYIKMILAVNSAYQFYWYDEQAGPTFYKNKSLVCIPK